VGLRVNSNDIHVPLTLFPGFSSPGYLGGTRCASLFFFLASAQNLTLVLNLLRLRLLLLWAHGGVRAFSTKPYPYQGPVGRLGY
jgi:hypothetical protein